MTLVLGEVGSTHIDTDTVEVVVLLVWNRFVYDSGSWFLVNGSKPQKPAWVLGPVLGVSR